MFTQNHSLTKVDAQPSDVITVLVSTNRPMVAVSGPAVQADAFIVSINRGKIQPVYLCFHLIGEARRLFFTSDKQPTTDAARIRIEQEAVRFVEDMGFMMVRERFDELSPKKRDQAVMGLAPFVDDIAEIRPDKNTSGKQKGGQTAVSDEGETEYEDVYEEVMEEVPIEEESSEPEQYESLSDLVTEIKARDAAQDTARKAADEKVRETTRKTIPDTVQDVSGEDDLETPRETDIETPETANKDVRRQPKSTDTKGGGDSFDLGREISDVVASIQEIPAKSRSPQEEEVERNKSSRPVEEPSLETASETRRAVIALLISL